MMNGLIRELFNELGIVVNWIVIELMENQQIIDMLGIQEVLLYYCGWGFQIVIDDFGEGFVNLCMWLELCLEFVKIDKYFVYGIVDDCIKFYFVWVMQDLVEICNVLLVVEGIEWVEDFICICDMGIVCGQGYFIVWLVILLVC